MGFLDPETSSFISTTIQGNSVLRVVGEQLEYGLECSEYSTSHKPETTPYVSAYLCSSNAVGVCSSHVCRVVDVVFRLLGLFSNGAGYPDPVERGLEGIVATAVPEPSLRNCTRIDEWKSCPSRSSCVSV